MRSLVLLACIAPSLSGQSTPPKDDRSILFLPVGSATESYLRYAQTLGNTPLVPWAIRPLSAPTLDRLADRSVGLAYLSTERPVNKTNGLRWQVLPVTGSLWYNTTYPFGWNDAAVWRGRGATAAIEGGFAARWGLVSVVLDPMAFIAENRWSPLMAVDTRDGPVTNPYVEPMIPHSIDRPQRFGEGSYGQFSAGQSTVRVDALGLTAGVSTANQWVGPMSEWPFLLSNNAAGFPHFFAGSSTPWNIGIGTIQGRIFYGGLSQTAFVTDPDSNTGRFITGITGSFAPRVLPGLEIGAGRIFEYNWPFGGVGWPDLRKPFEAFLKEHVKADPGESVNQSADNQLAALFARWVMHGSGMEIYGEYGRDDHNYNGRDAVLEPEHDATYGFGFRKAWRSSSGRLTGLRAELFNMEISTLARGRSQGTFYGHYSARQGHTQYGQVLGAGFAANSGAAWIIALDQFAPAGEGSSWSLTRMVMRDRPGEPLVDVEYAFAGERTRRIGSVHFTYGLTTVVEMNRYFVSDVGNVMARLGLRW